MVGDPAEIDVRGLSWDAMNEVHVLAHGVSPDEVNDVFLRAPQYFENPPNRAGSHIMLGPTAAGRFVYVVIVPTTQLGVWRPITAYRYARRRALRYYKETQ